MLDLLFLRDNFSECYMGFAPKVLKNSSNFDYFLLLLCKVNPGNSGP